MKKAHEHLMKHGKLCDRVSGDSGVIRFEFCDGTIAERVDSIEPLGDYRDGTEWWIRPGKMSYTAVIRAGYDTIEILGTVWPKNDGRWNWIRRKSKFQGSWKEGQGVTATKEEAITQVEKGWS